MAPALCLLQVQARLCGLAWDAAGEAATTPVIPVGSGRGTCVGSGGVPHHPAPRIRVLGVQLSRVLPRPGGSHLPAAGLEKI